MAAESYKSSKPGDAKFKPSIVSAAKDRMLSVENGGKRHLGVSNDQRKKLGRGLAKVANQRG